MIEQLQTQDQEIIALKKYIYKLLKLGRSSYDVKQLLIRNGLKERKAQELVIEVEEFYIKINKRDRIAFSFIFGFITLLSGIGIAFWIMS